MAMADWIDGFGYTDWPRTRITRFYAASVRRSGLKLLTMGVINYDRSITGDPRGTNVRLPGDPLPEEDLA